LTTITPDEVYKGEESSVEGILNITKGAGEEGANITEGGVE
jgi:hypothetical protein